MASRRVNVALRGIAAAAVLAGLAWLLRTIDTRAVLDAFTHAQAWPIALAAVINFGIILCKGAVWRILLAPAHRVSVGKLFRYTTIACAASILVPFRAGELVRVWLLRDRDGVPVSRSAAVAVTEKLLDVISMLLVIAPLPFLVDALPSSMSRWLGGLAIGVLAILGIAAWLGPRIGTDGWRGELARGLAVLRQPQRFALAIALLVAAWLIDLAMLALVFRAIGISASPGACVLVLFAINVAIALPSTPGHVGAFELGAIVGLRLLHIPEAPALAFGLIYHALQLIPVLAVGLALGAPEIWRRRS